LARLPKASMPPLPEIDAEQTAHANEALRVGRELMKEAVAEGRRLTFEDCMVMAEAAGTAVEEAVQQSPLG
jgi:hypothetical protein